MLSYSHIFSFRHICYDHKCGVRHRLVEVQLTPAPYLSSYHHHPNPRLISVSAAFATKGISMSSNAHSESTQATVAADPSHSPSGHLDQSLHGEEAATARFTDEDLLYEAVGVIVALYKSRPADSTEVTNDLLSKLSLRFSRSPRWTTTCSSACSVSASVLTTRMCCGG